ncbi:MAG TPA: DUF2218 domain-containing protein [Solirubrobacteraceae bacterium]|nr:DUF2218 domain-containing protein [Solirubrobacteraceae bacterium]
MSTALTATAEVATERPAAYMRQLCRHFGHRVPASFDDDSGEVSFEAGRLDLSAHDGFLRLKVSAADEDSLRRLRDVVGSHLERFGRRDGLAVEWS